MQFVLTDKIYLFDVLLGRVYKKIPEATYTFIRCTSEYYFIEVEDQNSFDIAGKHFIKESGSLKGSPRAFIRYKYNESREPNPAPFKEGIYIFNLQYFQTEIS